MFLMSCSKSWKQITQNETAVKRLAYSFTKILTPQRLACLKASQEWRHSRSLPPAAAMCFPFKKQKDNFTDAPSEAKTNKTVSSTKAPASKSPPTTSATAAQQSASASPAVVPATQIAAPTTQAAAPSAVRKPKIGIVIYSMYGHVARREFGREALRHRKLMLCSFQSLKKSSLGLRRPVDPPRFTCTSLVFSVIFVGDTNHAQGPGNLE
jgi:hypothetical protein